LLSAPSGREKVRRHLAGAQKIWDLPSVTVVIIRKDLAERADKNFPTSFHTAPHQGKIALSHSPTFAVYIVGLVSNGSKAKAEFREW